MAFQDTKTEPGADEPGTARTKKKKDAGGRKDAGHEGNPDAMELMKSLPRLKGLLESKDAASAAYNKAKKAVAKKACFQADVVHLAVKASLGEKEDLELQTRKAEQLSLALEAVGEKRAD